MTRIVLQICIVTSLIAGTLSHCAGNLQDFVNEDKPLALSIVSNTTSAPSYSVQNRTISFSVTFRIDRSGKYEVLHGSSCENGKAPAGVAQTGTLAAASDLAVALSVSLDDIGAYGNMVIICASDTAGYQKASATVGFSSALAYLANENEATGHGLQFSAGQTAEFVFFQANWTTGTANRGGGTAADTTNNPYQQSLYVDPNDNYRIKYFVVDRDNHRVLVFNTAPSDASASASVVIGQTTFTGNTANAGGSVGATGLDSPTHIAVSSTGRLYICDRGNNRVLGFNSIPQSNGGTADFVIGQPNLTSNTANNGALGSQAQRLNDPSSVYLYGNRLYIADRSGNRILAYSPVPTSTAPSASLAIGQADTLSVAGGTDYSAMSSYLSSPYELLFHNSRLYISDGGNHRVLVFNSVPTAADTRPNFVIGHSASNFAMSDCGLPVNSQCFNGPRGIAAQDTTLAISDRDNHRVLFFTLPITGDFATASYVLGQVNMTSNTAATTQAGLFNPRSLLFDSGYIWIGDGGNNRVVVRQLPY